MSLMVEKTRLTDLLRLTQRTQTINGKTNSHVTACVLSFFKIDGESRLTTVSLVKDRVSSLARFSIPVSDTNSLTYLHNGLLPINNIDTFLGVLKYHGKNVTLDFDEQEHKMRISSGQKKTTVVASLNALANPISSTCLQEAYDKAIELDAKIDPHNGVYRLDQKEIAVSPFISFFDVDSTDLFEAFRMDAMNKHKSGRFTLKVINNATSTKRQLWVLTGNENKGLNEVEICEQYYLSKTHESLRRTATFEGGLDHIFKIWNTPVNIHLLDFQEYKQGIKLLIDFGSGDYVLQSSVRND